jgi:hypothetical protein
MSPQPLPMELLLQIVARLRVRAQLTNAAEAWTAGFE